MYNWISSCSWRNHTILLLMSVAEKVLLLFVISLTAYCRLDHLDQTAVKWHKMHNNICGENKLEYPVYKCLHLLKGAMHYTRQTPCNKEMLPCFQRFRFPTLCTTQSCQHSNAMIFMAITCSRATWDTYGRIYLNGIVAAKCQYELCDSEI